MLYTLLTALCAITALAAGEHKERAKLPPDLEAVFGIAMAAPPEFASSAILNIASRVDDKELHGDLIDMAFRLASRARTPVRLKPFPGVSADTRSGNLGIALDMKMDALSLQARAVQDMIAVDPPRARELFSQIVRPALAPATCEDSLLPDMTPLYDALGAVIRNGFTTKEQARSEHVSFTVAMLSRIGSMAELAPAARMLSSLPFSRSQFEIAMGAFSSRLEAMPLDSRSFLYFSKAIEPDMTALVSRARELGASPDPAIDSYRAFLVAQFKGPRCADTGKPQGGMVQSAGARRLRSQFGNSENLFGETIRGERPPLRSEEIAPERVEGEMKLDRYWQSAQAQRVYEACLKLRQDPAGHTVSGLTRSSRDWTRQLTDFLALLASWRSNDEDSEEDYYNQKAIVYEALMELVPPGDMSTRLIAEFVDFLKSSAVQQSNPVEWFAHARSTVRRIAPNHPEQAAQLLAAYRGSGNIVLVLEAMLGLDR